MDLPCGASLNFEDVMELPNGGTVARLPAMRLWLAPGLWSGGVRRLRMVSREERDILCVGSGTGRNGDGVVWLPGAFATRFHRQPWSVPRKENCRGSVQRLGHSC